MSLRITTLVAVRDSGRAAVILLRFGAGLVGRVDIDFLSGPIRTGTLREPSTALVAEKRQFGASRRARWFDHP